MSVLAKKSSLKSCLAASVMAFALSSGMIAATTSSATAQDAAVEGRQFGSKAGQIVNDALQFINSSNWGAALSKLNEALAMTDLNPYERSTIYQMQGQAFYEQNQPGQAQSAFENAINAGGLLPNESDSLRVTIAQLMIGNGQYAQGAQMLENWANSGGQLKPTHKELIMQAWVQSENYAKALPWAEQWFNTVSPKERKHFDLLNFLYNNLGQTGRQADIVKQMINRWPEDKTLWDTWASMLANGGREQEAFEVTKMLYLGGALSQEQDLMKVVQYYSFYDMPFQAANILEKEMNAGRISRSSDKMVQLSDLFRQAREYKRAIPILESAAASSGQAKLYADLGEALYNEGQCEKAEGAFTQAINKGYDAGKSWMLIATCRYEDASKEKRITCDMSEAQRAAAPITKKRERAIEAFNRVPGSSREGGKATKWVSFIRAESKAVQDRCEFELSIAEELCMQKIKLAYDAQIFSGGDFNVDDQACMEFKPKFDRLYRTTTKAE